MLAWDVRPLLTGGPIEQLRGYGAELVLTDPAVLLASDAILTRVELD